MGSTYPAGVTGLYGETLSLSTTVASLGAPGIETKQVILYCPSSDWRLHLNPQLMAAYVYDNSQSGTAKWIDVSVALQDRATVGTSTYMDSLTTSDRLVLCFSDVTGGMRVVVASANDQANDLTPYYWNGSWTAITDTDGTDTGAALAQSGNVTWTAPTDALMHRMGGAIHKYGDAYLSIDSGLDTAEALDATETDITMDADPSSAIVAGDYILLDSEVMQVNSSSATDNLLVVNRGVLGSTAATHTTNKDTYLYKIDCPAAVSGFWIVCAWSASMGTNTEIGNIWALNKDSNRGYMLAGTSYPVSLDRRAVGSVEALLASGTDTLQVTWIKHSGGG